MSQMMIRLHVSKFHVIRLRTRRLLLLPGPPPFTLAVTMMRLAPPSRRGVNTSAVRRNDAIDPLVTMTTLPLARNTAAGQAVRPQSDTFRIGVSAGPPAKYRLDRRRTPSFAPVLWEFFRHKKTLLSLPHIRANRFGQ